MATTSPNPNFPLTLTHKFSVSSEVLFVGYIVANVIVQTLSMDPVHINAVHNIYSQLIVDSLHKVLLVVKFHVCAVMQAFVDVGFLSAQFPWACVTQTHSYHPIQ